MKTKYTLLITFWGFLSCTYDNASPEPMEIGSCDTTEVHFSEDIFPIIQSNCFMNCHNGNSPSSGFKLETYEQIKQKVDDGRLRGAVFQEPGFVAMPLGSSPLSDCDLAKIDAWIQKGALDD